MRRQQLQKQFPAQAHRRSARRQHFQIRVITPGLLQRLAETLTAQQRPLIKLRTDIRQTLTPPREQMLSRRFPGTQLRKPDAIHPGSAVQFHHVHARNVARLDHPSRTFRAIKPGQQKPARLVRHVIAQEVFFFVAGIVEVADQYFEALGREHPMNGFQRVDKQRLDNDGTKTTTEWLCAEARARAAGLTT